MFSESVLLNFEDSPHNYIPTAEIELVFYFRSKQAIKMGCVYVYIVFPEPY